MNHIIICQYELEQFYIVSPLSLSPYMLCPRPFLRYSFRANRAIIGNTSRATARPTYRATSDLATARAAETQHNTSIQGHVRPGHRPGSWNTTQHVNTGPHPTWPPPGQLKHNTTRQYRATSDLATGRAAETQHNTSVQGHVRPGHRPGSWNTTQHGNTGPHPTWPTWPKNVTAPRPWLGHFSHLLPIHECFKKITNQHTIKC